MSKKSATKSTTSTTSTRAKTVARPSRVAAPLSAEALEKRQANWRTAFDKAREAHERAREKGASAEKLAAYAQEQSDAWSAFVAARFARWGAVHAERIINRGDGTLPASLCEDSQGIRYAVIATLEAHLRHERSKVSPDADRMRAIRDGLAAAREHLVRSDD